MPTGTYKTPGVYIEEIPKLPPSIAEVETAIPVFIGYTQQAGETGKPPLPTAVISSKTIVEAQRITSLVEYETLFGKGPNEAISLVVEELYDGSGGPLKSRKVIPSLTPSVHTLYYHMQLYFANGGGPCYIISVGNTAGAIDKDELLAGIDMAARYDEPTLIVVPEAVGLTGDSSLSGRADIYKRALDQAGSLQDRFVIMDVGVGEEGNFRTTVSSANQKYGAAYYPFLRTTLSYLSDFASLSVVVKSSSDNDTFSGSEIGSATTVGLLNTAQQAAIKTALTTISPTLSPSAAVAGIYARVDNARGVWKAPANEALNMVSGLTRNLNDLDQASFNVDPTDGKSINVIRAFTGKGIRVWGARTLAGNDNEWRYVSVRRFFNMVEESTKKASGQFVFEPNDANTWTKVQGMIENYLTTLWRAGALQGAKPEHAFFVSVGLNKTMTALDILEGRMIVEIGMAVVRPAEFIILRFSHKMAES